MEKFRLTRLQHLFFLCIPKVLLRKAYKYFRFFDFIYETSNTQTPITFDIWYSQVVRKVNYGPYWPIHPTSIVSGWKNVYCGIETSPGYMQGNYISAYHGKITIGDYTQIGPNVGLIAANHTLTDNRKFEAKDIKIGKYCWIGMGVVVLPGVELGDYTIVAAGAIVTKSFLDGYQVIGGNPAKVLKILNPQECVLHTSAKQFNGFIPHKDFEEFRKKQLNV
jgi:acetyltransferase-like isoleucine patch superfamily enzyme